MKKLIVFILFVTLFSSCKESIQEPTATTKKSDLSVAKTYASPINLDIQAKEATKDWKEYNDLTDFFNRFKNISANDALNNATELKDLVYTLKDSIKPTIIDNNAFNARVHVLENETLRLVDMTKISTIKANEVHLQTAKVLSVFNSINEKINTIYAQKRFEETIKVNGNFINLDSLPKKEEKATKKSNLPTKKVLKENNTLLKQEKVFEKKSSIKKAMYKKNR